jgi:hypothetical protein
MDTPVGFLQFAFAVTDLESAHVCTENHDISDEVFFRNLQTYGLFLNESERTRIAKLSWFKEYKILSCSIQGDINYLHSNFE